LNTSRYILSHPFKQDATGDDIPACKSEKDEPIHFLEDPSHLQHLDSATLNEAITKHQRNVRILEEEVRRREEAREPATLQELYEQRREGERLASEYAPPPKMADNMKKRKMAKKKGVDP